MNDLGERLERIIAAQRANGSLRRWFDDNPAPFQRKLRPMPSAVPTPKVAAAGIAGAVSIILVWLLHTAASVDVPPEVASAVTTVLAFAAGYIIKEP